MATSVFVSGASGYLGSAVARRLVDTGYEVLGLTRDPARAHQLEAGGIRPVLGDMHRPEELIPVISRCQAVVHCAIDDDSREEADKAALDAIAEAARAGHLRRFIYTSGIWVHGPSDQVIDETRPLNPLELVRFRAKHESLALNTPGLESMVIRPAVVYGESRGILGGWFEEALTKRSVTYYGDGSQRWPMVHREDLAEGYLLALRKGRAGQAYLLADPSQHTALELAQAVASACGATAKAWPANQVLERLGLFGAALLASQRVSSAKADKELGWFAKHTSFVKEASSLLREFHEAAEE